MTFGQMENEVMQPRLLRRRHHFFRRNFTKPGDVFGNRAFE